MVAVPASPVSILPTFSGFKYGERTSLAKTKTFLQRPQLIHAEACKIPYTYPAQP